MYDEDDVAADGTGAVFNEVANAVQNRAVDVVAIFGYSHGGGSTYSLADLLDISRPGLGVFEIQFSSYVDAVRNNSDFDVEQELRRPPSSLYHLNQYQHGVFFEDLGLDGGPVPDSNPPPTGLDVETTPWGADATHFEIDDFIEVRDLIEVSLEPLVTRDLRTLASNSSTRTNSSGLRATGAGRASPSDDQAVFSPDPAWQAAIANVLRASTPEQQGDALDQLRALDDVAHQQLVWQVVYYSSHAHDTPAAMVAGAIIRELNIPNHAVIEALVPLLGTADPDLGRSVRSILGGFEGRSAGRRPDFSAYRAIIAEHIRSGQEPPNDLISYIYGSDPGEALLTLMRAYQLRQPADLQPLLWAEHVVADVLWKQRHGFLNPAEIEPAAARELASLARHPAWWARLYVAEVMRQHPAFRQPGLLEQLQRDLHRLVREAAFSAHREQ